MEAALEAPAAVTEAKGELGLQTPSYKKKSWHDYWLTEMLGCMKVLQSVFGKTDAYYEPGK